MECESLTPNDSLMSSELYHSLQEEANPIRNTMEGIKKRAAINNKSNGVIKKVAKVDNPKVIQNNKDSALGK